MHNPKVQDKPRTVGRAYAGDLLVQIAQHEDLDQKHYEYTSSSESAQESTIYSTPPAVSGRDTWPSRSKSRVLDSESLFPPMFFPRSSKRRSTPFIPPGTTPVKVSLGFRVFQVASILIVGMCLYALVDNIIFLVKTSGSDTYHQEDPKRSSMMNIHEQLQSWIIHGDAASSAPSPMTLGGEGLKRFVSYPTLANPVGQPPTNALTFLLHNSSVCSSAHRKSQEKLKSLNGGRLTAPGVYCIIVVHSAPDHFTERQAIRSTWGSVKSIKNLGVRILFVLGTPRSSPAVENSLRREHELFGDLIVGNFVDSYRNLTYKHLLGYKWITEYCPGSTWVLKADDDSFIDIFQLFDFISRNFGDPNPRALLCNVFPEGTKPVRSKTGRGSKWFVTMDEYPYAVYPRYCGGLAYLATPNVISDIYKMSQNVSKFFWIDDIFVTGILRELANIEPFYLNLRYLYDPEEYRNWLLPGGTSLPNNSNNVKEVDKNSHKSRLRKFPFLFAHIERGDKFSEEMNDLWRKTLRSL